jgi:hypothetical protein
VNLCEESARVRELLECKYGLKKRDAANVTPSDHGTGAKATSYLMEEALEKVKMQFSTRQIVGCYELSDIIDRAKEKKSRRFKNGATQTGIKAINENLVELVVKYLNPPAGE